VKEGIGEGEVIGRRGREIREGFFRNRAKHLESKRDVKVLFQ
jgi:hypothetical protein